MIAARCCANTRKGTRCALPQHAEGVCWTHYASERREREEIMMSIEERHAYTKPPAVAPSYYREPLRVRVYEWAGMAAVTVLVVAGAVVLGSWLARLVVAAIESVS